MLILRLLLTALTVLVSSGELAAKKKIPPCPAARYVLAPGDAGLIFGDTTPVADALVVGGTTLEIAPCGSARAKIKGTKKGTTVRATWKTCGDLKKVLAKATINPACQSAQGTIKAKKVPARTFSASLSTGCGDGVLDAGLGEDCEGDGDCDPGDTCETCACVPVTTTTVTTTTGAESTTTTTTLPSLCGNMTVDAGEECDDGDVDPTDGCTNDCTTCGNGVTTAPETCDDGNLVSGDGCDANCRPTGCGNGLITSGETCDDGNTDPYDGCPANCVEFTCDPVSGSVRQATVNWNAPSSVGSLTVVVDYPEDKVSLPGTGGSIPAGILVNFPSGVSNQANDIGNQGYALKEVLVKATAITPRPGKLFNINFEDCGGATVPTGGDFTCIVLSAFAPNGTTPVSGATCTVTVP